MKKTPIQKKIFTYIFIMIILYLQPSSFIAINIPKLIDDTRLNDIMYDQALMRGLSRQNSCQSCSSCSSSNATIIKKVPFTISIPGVYCLSCDFNQSMCSTSLIETSTDNVVLNLNGFALSGGNIGISIDSNLENVTIQNGSIAATGAEAILINPGCQNIELLNLNVLNCNTGNLGGKAAITIQGDIINRCTDILIDNVFISGCNLAGFDLLFCDNSKILNSCVTNLTNNNVNVASTIGFFIAGNFNICENCQVSTVISALSSQNSYGFYLNTNETKLKNCKASNIVAIASATKAVGFYISFCNCTLLENCISNNNSSTTKSTTPIQMFTYGFRSENSISTSCIKCIACGNSVPALPVTNVGTGFSIQDDSFDCIRYCISENNSTDGFAANTPFILPAVPSTFGQNVAINNGGFGFFLAPIANDLFFSNFASANAAGNYGGPIMPIQILGDPSPVAGVNIDSGV